MPTGTQGLAAVIRGHWSGSKIHKHSVRDALWLEDGIRSKNWKLNAVLAVLRAGLIGLRAQTVMHLNWPMLFERVSSQPAFALRLVSLPPK